VVDVRENGNDFDANGGDGGCALSFPVCEVKE